MSLHTDHRALTAVATVPFLILSLIIAVLPAFEVQRTEPLPGMQALNELETRGQQLYIEEGCGTCHTQFLRELPIDKPYGRGSVAGDYALQNPPLLGTQRTGPDLANVGVRQPSEVWNLMHLYNPRSVVPHSAMPAYPWYFEAKDKAGPADIVVPIPKPFVPDGKLVVASSDAVAIVRYLQALKQVEVAK